MSETRVRNQRRTSVAVSGFCDDPGGVLIGYARVLIIEQDLALQLDALEATGAGDRLKRLDVDSLGPLRAGLGVE